MTSTHKPSFIVVGPPRTGTSWLHKVLEPYATLPSPSKETRFFDLNFERGLDWYRWHFPRIQHGPLGEVAPTYFASREARLRIAETIPDAKIIFVFRNPVERAVSLYRLKLAYGMYRWSFQDALREDPELISSGMYWTHLREWRESFSDDQLLVTIYDDLAADPQAFVSSLTEFIGLENVSLSQAQMKRVFSTERMTRPRSYIATRTATAFADWCKTRRLDHLVASVRDSALIKLFLGGGESLPQMPTEITDELAEVFRPEVEGLESYLGRNLEHWRVARDLDESRASRQAFSSSRIPRVECSAR
ncbi:MAG: sulfotransferase domain-containing protein [Acidobacteria bacterium]|nr:sulfotransferase domain-containing protein [Acidobacteriota bacterium]